MWLGVSLGVAAEGVDSDEDREAMLLRRLDRSELARMPAAVGRRRSDSMLERLAADSAATDAESDAEPLRASNAELPASVASLAPIAPPDAAAAAPAVAAVAAAPPVAPPTKGCIGEADRCSGEWLKRLERPEAPPGLDDPGEERAEDGSNSDCPPLAESAMPRRCSDSEAISFICSRSAAS